ncbi:heparan sulfate glucosamine 3-O-sulfotransferase 1-like [Glandiceps talaboti]
MKRFLVVVSICSIFTIFLPILRYSSTNYCLCDNNCQDSYEPPPQGGFNYDSLLKDISGRENVGDDVSKNTDIFASIESEDESEPDWSASVYVDDYVRAKYDNFCYEPQIPYYRTDDAMLLDSKVLKARGCKQRLPQVIMPGVRKCGTGALIRFLCIHPNISGPIGEMHYFDSRQPTNLTCYRKKMPFTTTSQITMEKTPTYFYRPFNTPQLIMDEISPDTKIIITLCDPMRRAVSDYLEFLWRETDHFSKDPMYSSVRDTFERTVDDLHLQFGGIQPLNEIVDVGIYVKHLIRWYDTFPRDQILILDGTHLSKDPLPELRRVERFLGLRPFFSRDHFSYNEERKLFCVEFPSNACLSHAKGRKHPVVADETWQKLCEFYKPYNKAIEEMTGRSFEWAKTCPEQS